ncbi:LytR/AlgR family response regulator transcription factor [Brassicibacter mesophilus]|uniref:LytR/AlgR family response regulator transcription factor n=1 Tax=Brassicibacter mesophilus TaxID=745119 RepID=UPI003D20EC91
MKITIVICDDDKTHVDIIKEYIHRIDLNCDIRIIETYSGEEVQELLNENNIDIAFLDIEMRGLNGIEVGKKIRYTYEKAIIVFLTGYKHYALDAFQIDSFQYIIKPITFEKFHILMEKILVRWNEIKAYENKDKVFSIKTKQGIIYLKYQDIYFFERKGKKIYVYSKSGTYEFVDSLKSIMSRLETSTFLRCHNGFIVNSDKILNIDKNEIIFNNIKQSIPISRKCKKDVLDALAKNIF